MKGSRDEVAEVKLLSLLVGLATSVDGVEKDRPVEQRRSHWPLPFRRVAQEILMSRGY